MKKNEFEALYLSEQSGALGNYKQGIAFLEDSHVLRFLEIQGRPVLTGIAGDTQALATQAAYARGYFNCLDHLRNFIELFVLPALDTQPENDAVHSRKPDFGGRDMAIKFGLITEEEAKANGN